MSDILAGAIGVAVIGAVFVVALAIDGVRHSKRVDVLAREVAAMRRIIVNPEVWARQCLRSEFEQKSKSSPTRAERDMWSDLIRCTLDVAIAMSREIEKDGGEAVLRAYRRMRPSLHDRP